MSNSDSKLETSSLPTSIPTIGSPIISTISNIPKLEKQTSDSDSTEVGKKRRHLDDDFHSEFQNSPNLFPNSPSVYPNIDSVSENLKLEGHGSVSPSTEGSKRRCMGSEIDGESTNSAIPSSNSLIGHPNIDSVLENTKLESQGCVSGRCLADKIDEKDDGFVTPTDSDHKIPEPTECPWAPKKPRFRKSKSAPGARRNIFSVDMSDEEVESFFSTPVEHDQGDKDNEVA